MPFLWETSAAGCRLLSSKGAHTKDASHDEEHVDFPGAAVPACKSISFTGGKISPAQTIPCYRTLRSSGEPILGAEVPHPIDKPLALKMHGVMVKLQVMDLIFYEAQRQGRFSFYMTSNGEEATVVASAAALDPNDEVRTPLSLKRRLGAPSWQFRGFSCLQDLCPVPRAGGIALEGLHSPPDGKPGKDIPGRLIHVLTPCPSPWLPLSNTTSPRQVMASAPWQC